MTIAGEDSAVVFGSENPAILSASCGDAKAFVTIVTPMEFVADDVKAGASSVTAYLGGLPATCASRSLESPCVPHLDVSPALFYCKWTSSDGQYKNVGPVKAANVMQKVETINLALQPYLVCPTPSYDEVERIGSYEGDGQPVTLTLSVSYFSPDASPFDWKGAPSGNMVTFSGMNTPPVSPPPPAPPAPPTSPPSPPPPAPPNSVWGTEPWNPTSYTKSSGCSYPSNWGSYYQNLGTMTWKECVSAASSRKAYLHPGSYTCGTSSSWTASLTSNGYAYAPTQFSSFSHTTVSSQATCCIGADSSVVNNIGQMTSESWTKVSHAGSEWMYKDFGSMHHDQCTQKATQYGAHVITPSTVGLSSGGSYHVVTHHACCTYQFRSGTTGFSYQSIGAYQRSQTASCMLGIYLS